MYLKYMKLVIYRFTLRKGHSTDCPGRIIYTLSSATKQKLNWLKAQWVNETCRNLQLKVIKTAAFCHNRALQDLFPASYRLLFTTGSFQFDSLTAIE